MMHGGSAAMGVTSDVTSQWYVCSWPGRMTSSSFSRSDVLSKYKDPNGNISSAK